MVISSKTNEVIKTVLNLLFFFMKRFHPNKKHQKAPNAQKSTKMQPNKRTQTQISKQKLKNALKKHLSRKK